MESDGTITCTPSANYSGSDSFTYRARDAGGLTSAGATVALTIYGVNDEPAFASANVERSVSESANPGAEVGSEVTAPDLDEHDTLTYSLFGADARFFDIGRSSGQITVAARVTFDIAMKGMYTVTATDSATPPLSATIKVTITVTTGPVGPPISIDGGGVAVAPPAPAAGRLSMTR